MQIQAETAEYLIMQMRQINREKGYSGCKYVLGFNWVQ